MQIEYLCNNTVFTECVAQWIYDEFIKNIKNDRSYEEVLSKVKICYKDQIPIRLIAVIDGKCVGTVSIVQNDLKCRNYTPWLAALYVDKSFRGNGIAKKLIESVKNIVKDLGYNELYLRTEHASGYYKKLGWQFIESCDDDYNLKPDVFTYKL